MTSPVISIIIGVVLFIIILSVTIFIVYNTPKKNKKNKKEKVEKNIYDCFEGGGLLEYSAFYLDVENNKIPFIMTWERIDDMNTKIKSLTNDKKEIIRNNKNKIIEYLNNFINNEKLRELNTKIEEIVKLISKAVKLYENNKELIKASILIDKFDKDDEIKEFLKKTQYDRTELAKIKGMIGKSGNLINEAKRLLSISSKDFTKKYLQQDDIESISIAISALINKLNESLKSLENPNIFNDYKNKLEQFINDNEEQRVHSYTQSSMWKLSDFNPILKKIAEINNRAKIDEYYNQINQPQKIITSGEIIWQDNSNKSPEKIDELRDIYDNFKYPYARIWYTEIPKENDKKDVDEQNINDQIKIRDSVNKLATASTFLSHDDVYPAALQKWNIIMTVMNSFILNNNIFDNNDEKNKLTELVCNQILNGYTLNLFINALSPPHKNQAKGCTFKHMKVM